MLENISFKDIILAIIKAIDTINPILKKHHRRTAIIAYHLGKEYGLEEKQLANLVISAALHDVGALTVEDTKALVIMDVENPKPHSELGYKILNSYSKFQKISIIIKDHHIKFSEYQNSEYEIPFECLVLHLADRIEISIDRDDKAINQSEEVLETINKYQETLFSPELVNSFNKVAKKDIFWLDIDSLDIDSLISLINTASILSNDSFKEFEDLSLTISKIIDYKSPFTATHSIGVAFVSYALAKLCHFNEEHCNKIKIAGYLHDIGKISIPSELISKPGKLNEDEYKEMKSHVYHTAKILEHIHGMEDISKWASSHHETIDGNGYPMKLSSSEIPIEGIIIAYADIFTALGENRPYRGELPLDQVLSIIKTNFQNKLNRNIFNVLEENAKYLNDVRKEAQNNAYQKYVKIL